MSEPEAEGQHFPEMETSLDGTVHIQPAVMIITVDECPT